MIKKTHTILQNHSRLIFLGFLVSLITVNRSMAQNASLEFWPETDIWYRLSPSWRLSSFASITKYNESNHRDLNIYLQADYSWGKTKHAFIKRLMDENTAQQIKAWMARGGFMKGWSLGEHAGDYIEDLLFWEIHRRIPLKGGILFSQRVRTDFRWLGQDLNFSYRFRLRLMFEKEFKAGRRSIVPYVSGEAYWDSRYLEFSRVRLIGGTTINWGPRLAWEGNITYQYDEHYNTANLYALNFILHVFLERKKKVPS